MINRFYTSLSVNFGLSKAFPIYSNDHAPSSIRGHVGIGISAKACKTCSSFYNYDIIVRKIIREFYFILLPVIFLGWSLG